VSTVVHFAPHPDDELLGAPVSLFALRDLGWRVVNVAVTLGRPEQRERRLAEVREACARARFELRTENTDARAVLDDLQPALVVCPSPHDHHPTHELVGRDVLAAVRAGGAPSRVWLWAIYADLGLPTLVRSCGPERLREIEHALEAHAGELTRNDVRQMVRARAQLNAVLAAERVFGFGSPGIDVTAAELLTELAVSDGRFVLCEPRFAERDELGSPGDADVTGWLFQPSLTTQFGSRHC
jgi:LmbE family N-acetylglucosaminyl deacetylase